MIHKIIQFFFPILMCINIVHAVDMVNIFITYLNLFFIITNSKCRALIKSTLGPPCIVSFIILLDSVTTSTYWSQFLHNPTSVFDI